ncbi:MAG TPA: bifunctional 3-deoxy-7-phosphoheptulonate synthase/chorismate mutase [Myxococcota bacterium]|nr:bifunctional 3-deoxy-7-phosphoheptulonate synthase/chorismate mutase [Myxococcota bacterium]HQK51707.1 bifunctional 3-deoxy-7-phosphoheptulonate synthase/chorismate mutase [Myxococcota bacterium]
MTIPREIDDNIESLLGRIDQVNLRLLEDLSERGRLVQEMQRLKAAWDIPMHSPGREMAILEDLVAQNQGPFSEATIRHLFREILRASLALMEEHDQDSLRVTRRPGQPDRVIPVGSCTIGEAPVVIAGPCSVEGAEQMDLVAFHLKRLGVRFLRGGAFKPRTSPYDFQGLGEEGLRLLQEAGWRHGLATVSEVVDTRHVELAARYVDVLQIGSRNMSNYELLKVAAGTGRPVLLKRGFAATLDEFLHAAEYLAQAGNQDILLCERGIRSFERETRFTLDISAVPLLRQRTPLPVLVDVSHAAGRRDILIPLARAALAAGAQGVMVEVHPVPHLARSDAQQQLDLQEFDAFLKALADLLPSGATLPEVPAKDLPLPDPQESP